jgi:hypothetical protein
MFVAQFGPDGAYRWAATFGSTQNALYHVQTDAAGNIYLAGEFRGIADFDPGRQFDRRSAQRILYNAFVTKLRGDGGYAWTRTYVTVLRPGGFAVTPEGTSLLCSAYSGEVDVDPTAGVDLRRSTSSDLFLTTLHSDGSYGWTYTGGGPGNDEAQSVIVQDEHLLVSGYFYEEVQLPGASPLTTRCNVDFCGFLLQLNPQGVLTALRVTENAAQPTMSVGPKGEVVLSRIGNITLVDFDPTCGSDIRDSSSAQYYITKLECVPTVADFDADADVDLFDLACFQNCFEGVGTIMCGPGCDIYDVNGDNAIDTTDYSAVYSLLSGPRP